MWNAPLNAREPRANLYPSHKERPYVIYLLDCDLNGTDSIDDLIASGNVTHIPIDSYPTFEETTTRKLLPIVGPDDVVVLDTLSQLAMMVRGDLKLGTDVSESLWSKRNVFFADKNYLTVYEAACQLIMRRLKNLRARGARIITTCHETDRKDEMDLVKKRAPALNEAFFKSLMASSSDVFPLSIVMEDVLREDGTVKLAKDTRILNMRLSDDYVSKVHVQREVGSRLPAGIKDPTLPKLYGALGKRPSWLVIYGPPGAGKTTLACSDAPMEAKQPAPEMTQAWETPAPEREPSPKEPVTEAAAEPAVADIRTRKTKKADAS